METIIFIGSINLGGVADDGETMKNRMLLGALNKHNVGKIHKIDTRNRPKRILYVLKYIILLLLIRRKKIIFSASSFVTYKLIKIARLLCVNPNNIYYWVIGGKFADYVEEHRIDKSIYANIKKIFVEGESMKQKLNSLGFANVDVFPNFKNITYIPKRNDKKDSVVRFVFLSRIIPQKGVDIIIDAVKQLNKEFSDDFIVDFYGKIDPSYESTFLSAIENGHNINYQGFLNLTEKSGYDTLATYDVMLFPTFWEGEGFPGIIIDAYIAGLPIIASDWNLNSQIIKDGVTGNIIPPMNTDALVNTMLKYITREINIVTISNFTQNEATFYHIDNVITTPFLRSIGLL